MEYVIELEEYEVDAIKKALSMDEDDDFDATDIKLLLDVVLVDFL